jgi:acetyltransferase
MAPRYPAELETDIEHRGRTLHLRPMRPGDEQLLEEASRRLAPEDLRLRFFSPIHEISHDLATRLTNLDYDRNIAFLLLDGAELVGVVRLALNPSGEEGEFALIIDSQQHNRGYGTLLMNYIVDYARKRGAKRAVGHILRENAGMLGLAEYVGFVRTPGVSGGLDIRVEKAL